MKRLNLPSRANYSRYALGCQTDILAEIPPFFERIPFVFLRNTPCRIGENHETTKKRGHYPCRNLKVMEIMDLTDKTSSPLLLTNGGIVNKIKEMGP
jgi:hypothetical protein